MSKYKKTKAEKRRGHIIAVLLIICALSLLFIAGLMAVNLGYVELPQNFIEVLAPNAEPSSSTKEAKPEKEVSSAPPVPPELKVNNLGAEFNPDSVDALKKLLAKKPFSISLYYQNLSVGTEIEFNSRRQYPAGSVVKAPYCKWLLTQNPDLDEVILFTKDCIVEGAGDIQNSELNTPYTVRELIEAMIVKSDNTAYNMVIKRFGIDGYVSYVKSLGVSANQSKKNIFGNLSAVGAAILFKDIYSYGITSPEQSALLLDYMQNTTYYALIPTALEGTPVAHKYGYNGGNNGFHDAGIIYSETPYVLTVFSTLDYEVAGTEEYIRTVIKAVDKLHRGE